MSTGIKHWKLGDIALARMCKKVLAKVRVVKNEKGLFFDYKGTTAPYCIFKKSKYSNIHLFLHDNV